MPTIDVHASREIGAPPEAVYAILADPDRRRDILPPAFINVRTEGKDVLAYTLKAGRRERAYRMRQERTQQNRIVTERDLGSSLVTVFTVEPVRAGSLVTIRSTWQGAGGVGGFFERTFAPRVLQRLYIEELNNLAGMLSGLENEDGPGGAW